MNKSDFEARNKFYERIKKGLLGPGSDTWGLPDEEEIISDYPLIRYFTGVLFPQKKEPKSQFEADINDMENETSDKDYNETANIKFEPEEIYKEYKSTKIEDLKISHNNFFPNNIALSICVDDSVNKLDVEFSFGLYFQPSYKEKKIRISKTGFDSFSYKKIPYQLSFIDKLEFKEGFMFLDDKLDGYAGGREKERSGDYLDYDRFRKWDNIKDSPAEHFIHILVDGI